MNDIIKKIGKRAKAAFTLERCICRLIAAWCAFAACNLFGNEGDFFELSFAQTTELSDVLAFTLVFFFVFSVVNMLICRLESDTWFLLAAATVCVVHWLTTYKNSANEFLFSIAVAAAYSLFFIYFVNKNEELLSKWNPGKKTVWTAAIALGLILGGGIAIVTCYRYLTFSSPNFDFGLFVNMFHHMKESGLPLVSSERDVLMTHFAVHISPIYYILLPFYYVFPSPLTLQIGQAVVLASGIVPVVLLCRHFKLSGKTTVLVSLMYSLYPAISTGCFYDIHENCFLTPLLLWLFYFFEREKYLFMYVAAIAVFMVKEDAAIYVFLFALFVIFARKKYLHGSVLAVMSVVYFLIALALLEASAEYYAKIFADSSPYPAIAGPMINRFNNLIFDAADGLVGAIKTALVNPGFLLTQLFTETDKGTDKLVYFIQMLLPVAFLPFCTKKPSRWLLCVPLLLNLMTNYIYQYNIGFQYHFGIAPFLVYASIMNLPELKAPSRRSLVSIGACACLCMYLVSVVPDVTSYTKRYEDGQEMYESMEAALEKIPEEASVACSTFLLAHIADRDEVYQLDYHGVVADVDYVVFDSRYGLSAEQYTAYINLGYELCEDDSNYIVILKKAQ